MKKLSVLAALACLPFLAMSTDLPAQAPRHPGEAAQPPSVSQIEAAYWRDLHAAIRSRIDYHAPRKTRHNAGVVHEVTLDADGQIVALQIRQSSGLKDFDLAVKAAIIGTQPFPKRGDGKVPEQMLLAHKPNDFGAKSGMNQ